jgi:hypothetical protein
MNIVYNSTNMYFIHVGIPIIVVGTTAGIDLAAYGTEE